MKFSKWLWIAGAAALGWLLWQRKTAADAAKLTTPTPANTPASFYEQLRGMIGQFVGGTKGSSSPGMILNIGGGGVSRSTGGASGLGVKLDLTSLVSKAWTGIFGTPISRANKAAMSEGQSVLSGAADRYEDWYGWGGIGAVPALQDWQPTGEDYGARFNELTPYIDTESPSNWYDWNSPDSLEGLNAFDDWGYGGEEMLA